MPTQLPIASTEIKLTTTSVDIPIEQRAPGESAVRGASIAPFVPINEETVFLDTDPVTSSGISTMSSPMSCDSWMNYSSNSSDDLSAISDRMHAHKQQQQQDSSEESSLEFDTSVSQSTPKAKRNFNLVSEYKLTTTTTGKENSTVAATFNSTTMATTSTALNEHNTASVSQSKRLRGKSISGPSVTTTSAPSTSGSFKRKALLHRNSSLSGAVCDIRMIDFAHTTFVRKGDQTSGYTSPPPCPTVQHQGPDNGFLRGIESLRRLLTDIANDEEHDIEQGETQGNAAHSSTGGAS